MSLKVIEFFSGIGAFAQAARTGSVALDIIQAFDQNQAANLSYTQNYGLVPDLHNLDSIKVGQIKPADLWWMSPPCTPYSVRGNQLDKDDPRARSLLNLLQLLPELRPSFVLIENVDGIKGSRMEAHLNLTFEQLGYKLTTLNLCPTMFGVPMLRPRYFFVASRLGQPHLTAPVAPAESAALSSYIASNMSGAQLSSLMLPDSQLERYRPVLNIIDSEAPDSRAICFTSGYYKCRKASGSLIATAGGARFFAPEEILNLLGFAPQYKLPEDLPLSTRYRLVGNSVDVRSIKYLMAQINPLLRSISDV